MKKRHVMAAAISAMMYAAAAAVLTSCIWLGDWSEKEENGKESEEAVPMDEVRRVEEVLAGGFAGDTVWVCGRIVGGMRSDGSIDFDCGDNVLETALVIADDAACAEADSCLGLQLTKSAHKAELGFHDADSRTALLHREIFVQGKVTVYKKRPALNNLCRYKIE